MKRMVATAFIAALAVVATASAAVPTVHITIRHQTAHCHSWSVDGNAWKAAQSVRLGRGGTIVFKNTDVMPHKLVQLSGPALKLGKNANMSMMSATFKVTFAKAGVYKFKTIGGEDYMKGVKTTGADNVLTLKVTVT
jgi:plastocyanin